MSDPGVLKPRYGRIAAFTAAASTTLVAVVGALVLDPSAPDASTGGGGGITLTAADTTATAESGRSGDHAEDGTGTAGTAGAAASAALATAPSTGVRASLAVGLPPAASTSGRSSTETSEKPSQAPSSDPSQDADTALPASSGTGRRVVFSESRQRVWLVDGDGEVERTYLVSGSIYDNLDPGSYQVYSRSERATGVDGSELRYMVRFAHGDNAAIGFHWIPVLDGERMQTRAELGTALSHGCIRQTTPDARALWRFAPVGTTVVVTA